MEQLAGRLLDAPGVARPDFSQPPGAPALVPAHSVSWQVFANPVTLFVGGVTAVLLELAEPRVREGVWRHSQFPQEPLARLQRTGLAAMVTVYGPASQAREMIAGINCRHAQVAGTTPEGLSYRADDPELLVWVQATAAFGFLEAYARYARPLPRAQRDAYYAEGAPVARLYGAAAAPTSQRAFDDLLTRTTPRLQPSPVLTEFLEIMRRVPALPTAARPLQWALIRAAVSLLPPLLVAQLQLRKWRLRPWEEPAVRLAAALAERVRIEAWPVHAARRRLGLPP